LYFLVGAHATVEASLYPHLLVRLHLHLYSCRVALCAFQFRVCVRASFISAWLAVLNVCSSIFHSIARTTRTTTTTTTAAGCQHHHTSAHTQPREPLRVPACVCVCACESACVSVRVSASTSIFVSAGSPGLSVTSQKSV